jgi:hypothetical protein
MDLKESDMTSMGKEATSGEPEWLTRIQTLTDAEHRPLEYTYVKMIVWTVPADPLARILANPSSASTPLEDLLRKSSYGKILDAIEEQEAGVRGVTLLSDAARQKALRELAILKHAVYGSLLQEPLLEQQARAVRLTLFPTGTSETGRPVFVHPDASLQFWTHDPKGEGRPGLLGERTIRGGDSFVMECNEAIAQLLVTQCDFDALRQLRFRSKTPRGCTRLVPPTVTMGLVPGLYDYLQPFYPARPYTRERSKSRLAREAVPFQLIRDIATILPWERPDLCPALHWRQVLGAVHRYRRVARPDRRMGDAMFRPPFD